MAKASVPWMPVSCSRVELAAILGLSTRAIGDWAERGAFVPAPERGRYLTLPSILSYCEMMRLKAAGRASESGYSLAEERARLTSTEREIADLKLRKLKGEVLTLREVSDAWAALAGSVKANVLAISGKARSQIPHLTAHDGKVIKTICRDTLRAMAEDVEQGVVGVQVSDDDE
jgi:phage terminase Nu1 subunit (DNA packaging protein)